ncbi:4Fe-4S dicluster domain-containing protein, partial [Treponema sp.]|uniref:4Fe-4S dicluster domain-containing protein n=1 Tax=Treponema sp. TaxID=166 RepID=UPI003FD7C347
MQIENLKNCTGCSACFASCPKNAISLVPNEEGFLYPQIDSTKCIQCGLCEKVCPALNIQQEVNQNSKAFAVINNDEKIRMESSSGGVFTAVAKKVIEENGIVFGVKLDKHQKAVFSFSETEKGLRDFRGSKYVQTEVGNAFKECKKFLIENKKVLFTGTPCQIE